jgi:hypothetical protein
VKFRFVIAAAALFAASPALAQQTDLKSLPGGSLMLKDLPGAQGNVQNLPGVRLNMQAQGRNGAGNCTERQVTTLGFGDTRSGTVTECTVGNFSISTVKPSSGAGARAPYWADGIPNHFGAGPPPGSGGFAPQPNNGLW